MKVTSGNNTTEVETEKFIVLVSYSTPVAFKDKHTGDLFKSATRHSATTSRHVNKFLDGREASIVPQEVLNNLI